ncbi:hypothetical protein Tco_0847986, partial [Tanacetum coccineum]
GETPLIEDVERVLEATTKERRQGCDGGACKLLGCLLGDVIEVLELSVMGGCKSRCAIEECVIMRAANLNSRGIPVNLRLLNWRVDYALYIAFNLIRRTVRV